MTHASREDMIVISMRTDTLLECVRAHRGMGASRRFGFSRHKNDESTCVIGVAISSSCFA